MRALNIFLLYYLPLLKVRTLRHFKGKKMTTNRLFIFKHIFILCILFTLSACGGGSGSAEKSDTGTNSNLDITAPVITLNGSQAITLNIGNSYQELGASASDDKDGSVSVSVSGSLNLNQAGVYTFTYTATDSAGNSSSVIRTITVVAPDDTQAPTITLNGEKSISLELGESYQELGAQAQDNVDGTVSVAISGSVDESTHGDYTITYTAVDSAGNTGSITRKVTVLEAKDTSPPLLTLIGKEYIKLFLNEEYSEQGASALDDFDGAISATVFGEVDVKNTGVYIVTYTATDKAGNTASIERTVEVVIPREFITTWKTDNTQLFSTDANTIKIATKGEGYNFQIEWGDGTIDRNVVNTITHTYDTSGTYTIKISGDFPRFYFDETQADWSKLLTIEQWGDIRWSSMERAFINCSNLVINALDTPDLSNVTNLSYMFSYAQSFNQDINDWDVSTITDMTGMFQGAILFDQALESWDVSRVVRMGHMFDGATNFNQDISNWDTASLKDMIRMFNNASQFNQPIGRWTVGGVYRMTGLFANAVSFNQDLGDWKVGFVFYMGNMFDGASAFNQDIGRWNVSDVAYMNSMFRNAVSFDQNLSDWDISNLSDMRSMFEGIALSVENYDALLNGWSKLSTPPLKIGFHAGNSQYSEAGKTGRDILTNIHEWNIADGGLVQ